MNKTETTDDLQRAYAEARDALPACPTAKEIRRFQEGALPEERAFAVEFHLNDCAECIELVERIESGAGGPELEPVEETRLEEEIAAQLGLRSESPPSRLRDYISRLLTLRMPLYVPAAAAALLVGVMLIPRSAPEPAQPTGILPVSSIIIDQSALRSGEPGAGPVTIAPGGVVLIEVFLEGLEYRPGTPVTYTLLDNEGDVMLNGETTVLEDYNLRTVLRFAEPGTFTVRFAAADGERLLEQVQVNIAPAE